MSGSGNGSLAFIVISENDDARGVLRLSNSTYNVEEPSQNIVTIIREAGTFGMVYLRMNTAIHVVMMLLCLY